MRKWTTSLLALAVLCFGNVQVVFSEAASEQEEAKVYYCAEIDSSGFNFNKKKGSYERKI